MIQRPDGPADILDRLRVASRNGIMTDVCDQAISEIEQLRSRNDFLAHQVIELGHEVRQLLAENMRLRSCVGPEYAVAERSDCRRDELDMI